MNQLVLCPSEYFDKWIGLFAALNRHPNVSLTVAVDDVHPCGVQKVPFRVEVVPAVRSSKILKFPALRAWRRSDLQRLVVGSDAIYAVADASYYMTRQALSLARNAPSQPSVGCRAAQLVFKQFPWPIRSYERSTLEQVDLVASLNRLSDAVVLKKCPSAKLVRLPNGFDPQVFNTSQSTAPPSLPLRLVIVGEIGFHKGDHVLIEALRRLDFPAELRVIGRHFVTREYADQVRKQAEDACRERPDLRIDFIEWVPQNQLPEHYRRAHIVCLPSIEHSWSPFRQPILRSLFRMPLLEQFGRVLAEGMACGCIPLGSAIGGIPEVIGDAGYLVPPEDPDAIVRHLRQLVSNPPRLEELRHRALKCSAHFTWDRVAAELVDRLNKVENRSGALA